MAKSVKKKARLPVPQNIPAAPAVKRVTGVSASTIAALTARPGIKPPTSE